jgi:hypothetical protein
VAMCCARLTQYDSNSYRSGPGMMMTNSRDIQGKGDSSYLSHAVNFYISVFGLDPNDVDSIVDLWS